MRIEITLIFVVASLLLFSCTLVKGKSASAYNKAECREAAAGLSTFPENERSALDTLKIDTSFKRASELTSVVRLEGSCAHLVRGAILNQIALTDGSFYAIRNNQIKVREDASSLFEADNIDKVIIPSIENSRFVGATDYNATLTDAGLIQRYVGIWATDSAWTAGSFTAFPDGNTTSPQLMFKSNLELKGVTFFPSPDTASGVLAIVQKTEINGIRIISFRWQHN